jgi:hypothetical protein
MKYGSLNLLEPSGPVQACTGIPLPLFFHRFHDGNDKYIYRILVGILEVRLLYGRVWYRWEIILKRILEK